MSVNNLAGLARVLDRLERSAQPVDPAQFRSVVAWLVAEQGARLEGAMMSVPLHVVCPHCHATNRVRPDDLAGAPDCGQRHRSLFTGHSAALDESAFGRHVGRNDIPVPVDFWAPWCGPCRQMAPAFELAAAQLEARVVQLLGRHQRRARRPCPGALPPGQRLASRRFRPYRQEQPPRRPGPRIHHRAIVRFTVLDSSSSLESAPR